MCPKPNNTASELSRKSHVEDLTEPTPDLFAALTEDRDVLQRWLTFTFPVDLDVAIYKPKLDKEIKYLTINSEQEVRLGTRLDGLQNIHNITYNITSHNIHKHITWHNIIFPYY